MLKNKKIIDNLTGDENAIVISNGKVETGQTGHPVLYAADLQSVNMPQYGAVFPSIDSLSNSWNIELIEGISILLARRAKKDKRNAAITPDLSVKMSVFDNGTSEDPLLSAQVASAYTKGILKIGLMPLLNGCSLSESGMRFMDKEPNKAVIHDYVLRPFNFALKDSGGGAVLVADKDLNGAYKGFDSNLKNYNIPYIDRTRLSFSDVAMNDNNAAIDEKYSESVAYVNEEQAQSFALHAAAESVVLLKNSDNILPLEKGKRVAVIGAFAEMKQITGNSFIDTVNKRKDDLPFDYVGFSKGFNLGEERNDELIDSACTLAESADAVLLFLGLSELNPQRLSLPINQLALVNRIAKTGKKVIALMCGTHSYDMSFDSECAAVMAVPSDGTLVNETLLQILSGKVNPSGRLCYSMYDNTDSVFADVQARINSNKIKVGAFFGYRYYDTAGISVKYPFGFGLSYTTFEYSNIKANKDGVHFSITNTGNAAGWETAQVYAGKTDSNIVRPLKTLVGFSKVFLKAGESKTVFVAINQEAFAVCDPSDEKRKVEHGRFTIYVCCSVSHHRLVSSVIIKGQVFEKSHNRLSDYIQTKTNIIDGGYSLQEKLTNIIDKGRSLKEKLKAKLMKKGKNGKAVRENETVLKRKSELENLFLTEFSESESKEDEEIDELDAAEDLEVKVNSTKEISVAADKLYAFMNKGGIKFDAPIVRAILSAMAASHMIVLKDSDAHFLDQLILRLSQFFGTQKFVCEETETNGIKGINDEADSIGSLMFKRDINGNINETDLVKAINAAAQNKSHVHIVTLKNYCLNNADKAFLPLVKFAANPDEEHKIKLKNNNLHKSIYTIPPNLWFILVPPQHSENNSLSPIIAENSIMLDLKINKTAGAYGNMADIGRSKKSRSKSVSKNSKASGNSADTEALEFNSDSISNSVVNNHANESEDMYINTDSIEIGNTESSTQLNYLDFTQMIDECRKQFFISENLWKRFDRLEDYICARASYRISNKDWRRIERFTSVCLACGGSETEAVDNAVAAKLLQEILPIIKANPVEDNDFLLAVENIFGDENISIISDTVKHFML